MNSKARHPGASTRPPGRESPLELHIGQVVVNIWFDAYGIYFRQDEEDAAEGVLPWDVAMAMSLMPEPVRRLIHTPAA